ncbi:acyl-CoA dehydrogenase family protein, partial [Acidobacteria bacterium AH-259-G07]|nr:acyl-CoA dehydrogenase family protein [Acidobacteria bacterium AH-259-G07]
LIRASEPQDIFTPEDFTQEHHMIGETTQRFVDQELQPRIEQIEHQEPELTVELLRKAAELGLLAIDVSEKYGGLGLDKPSSTIVSEKLSQVGSFAVSYGAHCGIGTLPIVYFGTEEQKQKYLPKLANGELLSAYALTEAESGSDALAAKSTAVLSPDEKHWILNGEKMWITNAGFADLFIVFAKIDGKDFSAFIVERDFPGVKVGAEEKKMGIKGSSTRTLGLENVPVPAENVLGERGKGHKIALNILNIGRFKLGAGCVGGAKHAITDSVRYALERHQFGRAIAEFGAIREKLAEMAIRTWVAESMSYRTVGMIDRRLQEVEAEDPAQALKAIEEYAVECSIIKVWGTEMLDFVVDEAVQIYGGNGYSQEYPVERYYRDSRINRIFEGTNEINRLLITGMLLRRAMKGELALMQAAQQIFSELTSFPEEMDPTERLSEEKRIVENAKKASLMVAGLAAQKYGEELTDQQEILMCVTDMTMEVYAMESGLLRVLKIATNHPDRVEIYEKLIRCYIHDAIEKVNLSGKKVLAAICEGDDQRMYQAALRRFSKHSLVPSIWMRRDIAKRLLQAEGYRL